LPILSNCFKLKLMKRDFYFDKSISALQEELKSFDDLAELYSKGEVIPSGRGTARIIEFKEKKYILKKEARGGILAKFLPDRFFFLHNFDKEWLIQGLANSFDLSPPLLARWEIPKKLLLSEIYTLSAFIENCVSLKDLTAKGTLDNSKVIEAGKIIARMHAKGLYHGDLNCGNILFTPEKPRIIDFKGSYIFSAPLPEELSKKNLLRLLRSFYKESIKAKKEIELPFAGLLCEGYLLERNEEWVKQFAKAAKISKLRLWPYRLKL
jgi:tRNA A-37 threonylcarbamoyl transferase component Bud32